MWNQPDQDTAVHSPHQCSANCVRPEIYQTINMNNQEIINMEQEEDNIKKVLLAVLYYIVAQTLEFVWVNIKLCLLLLAATYIRAAWGTLVEGENNNFVRLRGTVGVEMYNPFRGVRVRIQRWKSGLINIQTNILLKWPWQ